MRLPVGTRSLAELPPGFEPQTMGSRSQIVSKITLLGAEWISVENRTLGVIRDELHVVELELPAGPIDHLTLTLHGEDAVDAARAVLDVLDAAAVDLDTDAVVDLGAPASRRQARQTFDLACTA